MQYAQQRYGSGKISFADTLQRAIALAEAQGATRYVADAQALAARIAA